MSMNVESEIRLVGKSVFFCHSVAATKAEDAMQETRNSTSNVQPNHCHECEV